MALGTGDGCLLEADKEDFLDAQPLLIFDLRDNNSGRKDKDSDDNGAGPAPGVTFIIF